MTERAPKVSLSERLFDGRYAESELETLMEDLGVPFERLGWDHYDCSVELYDVPPEYRLGIEAQRAIHGAGFCIAFMNHADKWETHYRFKPNEEFAESKGWRVSYPHKRGENEEGIWVEEVCSTWPKDWFESGYCIVKAASHGEKGTKEG